MCANDTTCPVHYRLNVREDVTDRIGEARAFTYEGEYCIATMDNPAFFSPMTALLALLGEPGDPLPGMFITIVAKVGDKAVGDLSDAELKAATVHEEEFARVDDPDALDSDDPEWHEKMTEIFHNKHDEAVLAVQSGMIS